MARQTIVSTQQAERITDRALRHIRPIFGKCYGYPKGDSSHQKSMKKESKKHRKRIKKDVNLSHEQRNHRRIRHRRPR
ncbi:hypothetical protein C6Y44_27020 (plasmid) [Rhodococcus rhodochrous]|nr:hypothetical protein C6Y44_27020 [Rhodococcus rhodochrous]